MAYRRRIVGLLAAAIVVIGLAGCVRLPVDLTPVSVSPANLVGTWTIDKTFDAPEQPYISFLRNGTWSASDGCNRVRGTWEVEHDGKLSTTSGPQTMMACDGAQLPLAVSKADRVEVRGKSLILHSSFDSTETTLVRARDPRVGPQGLPIGYWVESRTPDSPFLSIRADRSYSGNDGCNVITGRWTSTGDSIRLIPGATSLKACEGVDQWLSEAVLGRVQRDVMTLEGANGDVLGQLTGM